jgi:glycosyltransferase involved in cell wall biosynthesis
MLITVAICTLNRAASLARTLESLAAMQVPGAIDWELVVVNNGCTDATDEVVGAFAGRLPLRRAFEGQRGHSPARNRAVDAARGDYLVWTDDDVVVDCGWLAAYDEAFRRWPEAAVFGGPITPRFEPPTPKWVVEGRELIGAAFAERDFGDAVRPLGIDGNRIPYGPNFALRAREQRSFRYDPELGHATGRKRYGEEFDVVVRILRSGASGYWVPTAKVEHCIARQRQTVRYIRDYFAGQGETSTFLRAPEPPAQMLFGVPRWKWRLLAERWLRFRLHRVVSPPAIWKHHLIEYGLSRGEVRYWRSKRSALPPVRESR